MHVAEGFLGYFDVFCIFIVKYALHMYVAENLAPKVCVPRRRKSHRKLHVRVRTTLKSAESGLGLGEGVLYERASRDLDLGSPRGGDKVLAAPAVGAFSNPSAAAEEAAGRSVLGVSNRPCQKMLCRISVCRCIPPWPFRIRDPFISFRPTN